MDCIGIDKTVVKNFTAKSVNYNRLLNEGNVEKVMCLRNIPYKENYFIGKKEDNFNTIKIEDGIIFDVLKLDVKRVGNQIIQYGILDMSIRELGGNNLIPLTINAYRLHLKKVFKYVEERYGIVLDTREVKFEKVELNATIKLEEEFGNYIRAFDILMNLAPKTYKSYLTQKNKYVERIDYFLIKNNSIQCKFYNKSSQIEDVYSFDGEENILRIEYTLLSGEKVKDVFGDNDVKKINDNEIKNFIKKQLTKDFVNRYNKYKEKSLKEMKKKAKEYQKENTQWIKSFILYVLDYELGKKVPLCLDVEHLKIIIKGMDKVNYKRNLTRVKKDLPKSYENQEKRILEIFQKIEKM